jgi:type IV secretion system protein VirB11
MVNADGSVWIDKAGDVSYTSVSLSVPHRLSIIRELAGLYGLVCTRDSPTLACRLPGFWCTGRVQAVIPPISDGPELCIRFPSRTKLTLEDLVGKGMLTRAQAKRLNRLVMSRCNGVIAGGTGSGKTTLLVALLDLIENERLGIIEDTPEVFLNNKNTFYWQTNPTFSARDAVKTSLRYRPDRIILGEVRDGAATLEWLKASSTGHPGSVCTIHANSAAAVHNRMYALMQEEVVTPSNDLINDASDYVVYIEKTINNRNRKVVRKVQEILTSKSSKETSL